MLCLLGPEAGLSGFQPSVRVKGGAELCCLTKRVLRTSKPGSTVRTCLHTYQNCSPNVLIAWAATPRQNNDFFYFFKNIIIFHFSPAEPAQLWMCELDFALVLILLISLLLMDGLAKSFPHLSPFLCSDSPGLGCERAKKEFDHEFWLLVRLNKPGWHQSTFLVSEWNFRVDVWRWGGKAYGH